jgi:hypothetical protein
MSLTPIGRYSALTSSDLASGVSDRTAPDQQPYSIGSAPVTEDAYTSVTIAFSPAALIYGKLQNLSESDPSQFKKVTAEVANALKDAAKDAGSSDSKQYKELSKEFSAAAKSGKMSSLSPNDIASFLNISGLNGDDDSNAGVVANAVIHTITVPDDYSQAPETPLYKLPLNQYALYPTVKPATYSATHYSV